MCDDVDASLPTKNDSRQRSVNDTLRSRLIDFRLSKATPMEPLKQALNEANIEIYGEDGSSLKIAERHRYHLMDSGVRAEPVESGIRVGFVIRAQRSDFPHMDAEKLFAQIRETVGPDLGSRGYDSVEQRIVEVQDPVDASKLLDVWYELFYAKNVSSTNDAIEEIRWALGVDKYLQG